MSRSSLGMADGITAPPEGGETVTVNVSSSDVTEGTVSPASLDFTAANWNIYQFVTVTPGAAGDGNDGNVAYTISNTASGNPASGYSSENADVSVTNNDVDGGKLIIVDPVSGLSVDEEGSSSATFTVRLTENPSAGTVTVTVDSDANTQVSLDDATYQASVDVVMSDTTPVTVYVQGDSSDSIDEDDVPFTVTTNMAVVSDDVTYEQNPADVTGTVTDDDTAGFMVAGGPLSTTEAGGSDSFTISITSEPAPGTTVTVDFLSSNTDEADSPASVVFTPANWSDPAVIVTVNGVDDDVDDGDQPFTIQATVNNGGGTDPVYAALDPADVEGTNTDDDTFGMTVSPTSGLTTAEADNSTTGSASFTVVLDSEPTFDVSVDAATDDATEGLIGTAMGGPFSENLSLTFTPANWDTPQTVWVAGVDDILRADGDIVYNISVDSSSDDPQYEGLSDSVEVTNLDDVGEECTEPVTLSYDGNSITIVGTPGCEYEIYEGGTAGVNDGTLVCSGIIPDSGMTSCVPGGGVQEDTLYQAFSPGGVLLSNGLVTVPTLGEWALIAFITMLMAAGVVMMRRRRLEV